MTMIVEYDPQMQSFENSCWAAVANSVIDYMNKSRNWGTKEQVEQKDEMDSAIRVLQDTYPVSEFPRAKDNFVMDTRAIPWFKDIRDQIDQNNLFVCNISWCKTERNPDFKGGHWIAIIGYEEAGSNLKLLIHDPAFRFSQCMEYNDENSMEVNYHGQRVYFANTSYIDVYPVSKKK